MGLRSNKLVRAIGRPILRVLRKLHILPIPVVTFRESRLAHKYLDGLAGLEIGGAAHNRFGLNTINLDMTVDGQFAQDQIDGCGWVMPVDVVGDGARLPFLENAFDFVVSSHVLEHFWDPIQALQEWHRVVRNNGFIFAIVPHKERTYDSDRPRTTLEELIARHNSTDPHPDSDGSVHHSVWVTKDVVKLIKFFGKGFKIIRVQDPDDKVRNGFTVLVRVRK